MRVLWLDNDVRMAEAFSDALLDAGLKVNIARSISEADSALRREHYDLLILDAMIPVSEAEEQEFPGSETDDGGQTGLVYFRKRRARLAELGTRVFVFTVRLDKRIQERFVSEGLPSSCFANKVILCDAAPFVAAIKKILAPRAST